MGMIKLGLITLDNQEVDVYYCDPMPNNVLIKKAQYRSTKKKKILSQDTSEKRSIKDGSKIIVGEGQCMILVFKGMVTEICTEPGEYKFEACTSPSSVYGSFLDDFEKEVLKEILEREKHLRYEPKDEIQADIFYLNTDEILNNKFGCEKPTSVCERLSGFDSVIDIHLIWSGEFSFRIANPVKFYSGCGFNKYDFTLTTDLLNSKLKNQINEAMEIALVKLSKKEINHTELLLHKTELYEIIQDEIEGIWLYKMGIKLWDISPLTIHISKEDEEYIRTLQNNNFINNSHNAANTLSNASKKETKQISTQIWKCSCGMPNSGKYCSECGKSTTLTEDIQWICECNTINYGKYCVECGKEKPPIQWTCSCGTLNNKKFCTNCGKKNFSYQTNLIKYSNNSE